jgi:rRNA maturation RNase YbeY
MGKAGAELSVRLARDPEIRELNRRFRARDEPTDVLSFALGDEVCPDLLGDVVISVETARRQARASRTSAAEEVRALLVHGILHLLGYDHETSAADARRMREKERELASLLALG